jgi:thymidine kinase
METNTQIVMQHKIVPGFPGPVQVKKGRIEYIGGPVNSGKTSEFLSRMRRHRIAGRTVKVVKSSTATRDGTNVMTYSGDAISCDYYFKSLMENSEELLSDYPDVIGLEECQFFTDVYEFATLAANNYGVIVIGCGLNLTSDAEPFNESNKHFMCNADVVDKFNAICVICQSDYGSFSYKEDSSGIGSIIDPLAVYKACCRSCYYKMCARSDR